MVLRLVGQGNQILQIGEILLTQWFREISYVYVSVHAALYIVVCRP